MARLLTKVFGSENTVYSSTGTEKYRVNKLQKSKKNLKKPRGGGAGGGGGGRGAGEGKTRVIFGNFSVPVELYTVFSVPVELYTVFSPYIL